MDNLKELLREGTPEAFVTVVETLLMREDHRGLSWDEWNDVGQIVWKNLRPIMSEFSDPSGKCYDNPIGYIRRMVQNAAKDYCEKKSQHKRLQAEVESRLAEEAVEDRGLSQIFSHDERNVRLKKLSEILLEEYPKAHPVFLLVCLEEVSPKVAIKRLRERGIDCCSLGTFRNVVSKLNGHADLRRLKD